MSNWLIPFLTKCGDCENYSDQQKTIFFGISRASVSVVSLGLCAAFLAKFSSFVASEHLVDEHRAKSIHSILIVICVVNVIQFLVSLFIILIVRSNIGKPRSIKFWLIIDIAVCTVNILCILILMFTIPPKKLFLIIGVTVIILSLFLSYRSSVTYVIYKLDEDRSF